MDEIILPMFDAIADHLSPADLKHIHSRRGTDDMRHIVGRKCADRSFKDKLDANIDILAADNGVWEVGNKTFRPIEPEDFVMTTTGWVQENEPSNNPGDNAKYPGKEGDTDKKVEWVKYILCEETDSKGVLVNTVWEDDYYDICVEFYRLKEEQKKQNEFLTWQGGARKRNAKPIPPQEKPKWVSTRRKVTIQKRGSPAAHKTVFRNSVTKELRVRKATLSKDGTRRFAYVKF